MKHVIFLGFLWVFMLVSGQQKQDWHYNESMFKELDSEWPTPNVYRTAAGAPGSEYYQQRADYVIAVTLNEAQRSIDGEETITYYNNSPDKLEYLWVQLDQNVMSANSPSKAVNNGGAPKKMDDASFSRNYVEPPFPGGFNILSVNQKGKELSYTINQTMMRINLEQALEPGKTFVFSIKWNYNIADYFKYGGRSGYEYFPKDDNCLFIVAQFFPRMAVYSDVEGWQNMQFWGRSEFALVFGNYDVSITVPEDHILNGTGEITNMKEVLSSKEYSRWEEAQKSFDNPVIIVSQQEAEQKEKQKSKKSKTWKFHAENVRDFAFSTSRKFIWDAMAVKVNDRTVMAISLYPKEGNPLWEKYSTRAVAHTLKEYSKLTFTYPYNKAISINADRQGMEYPMICWNYGRPLADGTVPESVKTGMISVITHEVGHNFFPMIVNSDERQWTWMDEGLNTFCQFVAEQNMPLDFPEDYTWEKNYPSRRGFPKDIVDYMSMNQEQLMPIMTQGDHVFNFGANAYGKPATGLAILRNTIMGPELFDYSFRMYSQRWMFKHPSPADFFRTMEDASGVDLDWFWRGWFYTTAYCDIGIKEIKQFSLSEDGKEVIFNEMKPGEIKEQTYRELENLTKYTESLKQNGNNDLKFPKYFYEITFEKPGGLIMPILLTFEFKDGTVEQINLPYMVWRLHENRDLPKFFTFNKPLAKVTVDKKLETADINLKNNVYELN